MAEMISKSTVVGDTLELHYWFEDKSHTIDAIIQNRSEFEFLNIIKQIALIYEITISIETEPSANGGIKKWFKIIYQKENKSAMITSAVIGGVILALITGLIINPIIKIEDRLIEKMFENKEDKQIKQQSENLQNEKTKSEIEKNKSETEKNILETESLKQDLEYKTLQINRNSVVIKRRSNFYETLATYSKLKQVSFVVVDENKSHLSKEAVIQKNEFKKFILVSDDLTPIEIENAIIDIVSPVLKKGNYQWRGVYNGEVLSFNMKSIEFKILVQSGSIEFKNGTSIRCLLRIDRKINNEGAERIISYNIMRVDDYFENDKPIETPEGKSHRKKQKEKNQQIDLFSQTNDNNIDNKFINSQ